MSYAKGAEDRLIEWALWLQDPYGKINCFPSENTLQRLRIEGAGASGGSSSQSDGGMVARVSKMGRDVAIETRAKEVQLAVSAMPPDYQALVRVTYMRPPREIPCPIRTAADVMKITEAIYRKRKERMLGWLEGRLCLPVAA